MKNQPPTRPTPIGANLRGITIYSGEELSAYRLLNGVRQGDVASRIGCAGQLIDYYESGTTELQENQARQMMDAVDWAVGDRDRLVAKGEKLLAELAARGKRGTPPPSRGSWRTEKEAKAIQEAQARGER